jgi:hypothetical protein
MVATEEQAPNTEELGHGVRRVWFDKHQIYRFTFVDLSPEAVAVWADTIIDDLSSHPRAQPYLGYTDLTNIFGNIVLNAYTRQRLKEIISVLADYKGRLALVIPQSAAATIMQMILEKPNASMRRMHLRVFYTAKACMNWLTEGLPENAVI